MAYKLLKGVWWGREWGGRGGGGGVMGKNSFQDYYCDRIWFIIFSFCNKIVFFNAFNQLKAYKWTLRFYLRLNLWIK